MCSISFISMSFDISFMQSPNADKYMLSFHCCLMFSSLLFSNCFLETNHLSFSQTLCKLWVGKVMRSVLFSNQNKTNKQTKTVFCFLRCQERRLDSESPCISSFSRLFTCRFGGAGLPLVGALVSWITLACVTVEAEGLLFNRS